MVRAQLPQVAVPEVGDDPACYVEILDRNRYFESVELSAEDFQRRRFYQANSQRDAQQSRFTRYEQYLESLDMTAEIGPFQPLYLDRITQLINKTNQINLTTRRYTATEVRMIAESPQQVTLYGRLSDKFGDNGLVSVIIGSHRGRQLEIDLWLMSCRVFKRSLEYAMFAELIRQARAAGVEEILGTYLPTAKNGLVAEFYRELGFELVAEVPDHSTHWRYNLAAASELPSHYIRIAA